MNGEGTIAFQYLMDWFNDPTQTKTPANLVHFDKLQDGLCLSAVHDHPTSGTLRLRNTAYVSRISNVVSLCDECMAEEAEYWRNAWDEYYSSVM